MWKSPPPPRADILARPPKKVRWKKTVKAAVFKTWTKKLWEAVEEMSTMEFLNPQACSLGQLHPVWQGLHNQLSILKATAMAQLPVKRYSLSNSTQLAAIKRPVPPLQTRAINHNPLPHSLQCPSRDQATLY